MFIGAHCSISGGIHKSIDRIIDIGGNTLQIFSGNPRGWKKAELDPEDISLFKEKKHKNNIGPIAIHTTYLINIASGKDDLRNKSIAALSEELERADLIGADYVVLHPGSYTKTTVKAGKKNITNSLNKVFSEKKYSARLLLENTAGSGKTIGKNLNTLNEIRKRVDGKTGLCIDTAHAFGAGIKIEDLIENSIAKKAQLVHINDSKVEFASHRDRHDNIGKGQIEKSSFKKLLTHPAWKDKPFILETPGGEKNFAKDIKTLKALVS